MIQHYINRNNPICLPKQFEKFLLVGNHLSEYYTEEDKIEVLNNLGVPDLVREIIQEYIVQHFGDSEELAISQKTLTESINSINNRIDQILENDIKADITTNPNYAYIGIENEVTINLNLVEPANIIYIYKIIGNEDPIKIFESVDHKITYQITDTVIGQKDKNIIYEAVIMSDGINKRVNTIITSRQRDIQNLISWQSNKEWITDEDNNKIYATNFSPGNIYPELSYPENIDSITYTSSNRDVAIINEDTGKITITGFGDSIITAFVNGGDEYTSNSISYILRIKKEQANIQWNPSTVTTDMITKTVPIFINPSGVTVRHTIVPNDETITIDNNIVHINKSGNVQVRTIIDDSNYEENSAEFNLIINKATPSYNWNNNTLDILWGQSSFVSPILRNVPQELTVTYELISGNDVISINSNGKITEVLGLGQAIIKASTPETSNYVQYSKNCTINVIVPPIPDYYIGWTNGTKKQFSEKSPQELIENATIYMKGFQDYSQQCQDIIFYLIFKEGTTNPIGSLSSGGFISNISTQDFINGGDCPHDDIVINNVSYKVFGTRNTDYPTGNNIITIQFN